MADCGATGSALDRASRAMLGGGDRNEAAKQVASLVGHAAFTGSTLQPAMPATVPNHLVMPTAANHPSTRIPLPSTEATRVIASPTGTVQHPHAQQQQRQQHYVMEDPRMMQHHHVHTHQQAAMQMQMLQQQQQQLMMMQQQQQQLHQMRMKEQHAAKVDQQQEWHEGLEEEAKAELRRHLEELDEIGHEGQVQGATIEELAAAWAEAEADYQQLEDVSNLWSGATTDDHTYDFMNKDIPEDVAQTDWMEEGIRQFKAGNLKQAIRAFEMELQHSNADNAAAWRMLGRCHAENDQDREAIICLEQAVDRDPYSPEALLALGVSYVNELNHTQALESLKSWITHNPKYAGMELNGDLYGSATAEAGQESAFDEVQRLLLRALEFDPTDAADVLEALGVVYNVSRDYEAAVDSFRKAIDIRPDDYQLWNKLGATLANSSKSDQALPAYHKALQLKPKYARAWLNMAISHSNLQNYEEAARCYLQTLSLNPSAIHCWSYLRIALSCAERWDLIPYAASQDLSAFREHFDFVMYNQDASTS